MFAPWSRDDRISPEEVHEILRNDRRRQTIQYLKRRLEPVSLRELSEAVAKLETKESPVPRNIRQSVYNSLHQTHLPKLDEVGIVDYDKDRKTVVLRERARDIDVYMDVVTRLGVTWTTFYRTVAVIGLVSVVLADTDVAMFAQVESLVFATVCLFVFAVATAYQLWSQRWFYLRSLVDND